MADIFVSYAREDEARVRLLVQALESAGHSVFWDRRIPAGRSWREHIGSALAQARCVLVAWSRHSVGSGFVAEEADAGGQRGVLLPVLIDPVLPPLGFRGVHAADLSDWRGDPAAPAWLQLQADLDAMLATAPRAPAGPAQVARAAPTRPPVPLLLGLGLLATGALGWLAWTGLLPPAPGPAAAPPPASVAGPVRPVSDGGGPPLSLRVVELWRDDAASLSMRVEVRNDGGAALTFAAARQLQLELVGQPPAAPQETRPLFETLQPGQSQVFVLRYAVPPGAAPRLTLHDTAGHALGEPLPLPAP